MKHTGTFWRRWGGVMVGFGLMAVGWVQGAAPLFRQDFSQVEVGKLPEGFLVLDGQFSVKEEAGQRFLELPGAPLETFGVMFGPGNKEDWGAQARFWGTGRGRRFPVFGVSVNGVGGYRIQVSPAKRAIEVLKADEVKASAPYDWESGVWTVVRVQIRKVSEGVWSVEGKAWKDGSPEPEGWAVNWEETEGLVAGRAAIWGKPFAGTPIRFDDLTIQGLAK